MIVKARDLRVGYKLAPNDEVLAVSVNENVVAVKVDKDRRSVWYLPLDWKLEVTNAEPR